MIGQRANRGHARVARIVGIASDRAKVFGYGKDLLGQQTRRNGILATMVRG